MVGWIVEFFNLKFQSLSYLSIEKLFLADYSLEERLMANTQGCDFLFCHLCGTMLTAPSPKYAQCPLCKTKRDINDVKDKEISYTISAEDIRRELGIVIMEEQKVQLSKVNKKCEKCGHGEANFYTRQMRSADEGQTTFYTCTRCGHQFQEN